MADAGAHARAAARSLSDSFRVLSLEQKVAAVASLLLIASTFGPFSFIEAAEIVTALGVLTLLHFRAQGRRFHLPFGDGTVIAAAGVWVGLLIVVRLFDRPLGQNLLALACAAILAVAGASERAKRPPDDLPDEPRPRRPRRPRDPDGRPGPAVVEDAPDAAVERRREASRRRRSARATAPASRAGRRGAAASPEPSTVEEPLAPPEFEPTPGPSPAAHDPTASAASERPSARPAASSQDTGAEQLSLEDALDAEDEPTRRLPPDQG
jgi:hypothetical protein